MTYLNKNKKNHDESYDQELADLYLGGPRGPQGELHWLLWAVASAGIVHIMM